MRRRRRTQLRCLTALAVFQLSVAPALAASAGRVAASDAVTLAIHEDARGAIKRVYAERGFRPLWATAGTLGPAADRLIAYLASADLDGLRPRTGEAAKLAKLVAEARAGGPHAVAKAELALSIAFAQFVQEQRRARGVRMIWADEALRPRRLRTETVLRAAGFARSFADYVASMGWMSDQYVRLRQLAARARDSGAPDEDMARLRLNLDRARLLPGPWTRHILVDASSARLWFYENGRQVGTMRVVVGAKETQTPMLVGTLQWAILNPYWNVPDYLAQGSIARKVLGGRSLAAMHMEALSDWSATASRLDPATIDWTAVAAGKEDIRIRQLPGPFNSMGRVKFLFPNGEGIYLHDTPERDLLKRDDRHLSNGCIRLENAPELGRWLLQKPLPSTSKQVEQALPVPVPVPVFLTYLTAMDTPSGLAFREDIYDRDGKRAGRF